MLSNFDHFLAHNLLTNKYFKPIFKKNLYLFLLGLSFSVGDLKLILATVIFILSMVASYQLKTKSIHHYVKYFRNLINRENKQLVLSTTIAGLLSFLAYFALNIYEELDNTWLALFVISQTLFSTLGIVFFSKYLFSSSSQKSQEHVLQFEDLVPQLNHDASLHRLWVINQLMSLWHNHQLTKIQITQLEEYLLILKNDEYEPVILAKIDHSLEKLSHTSSQPLNIPRSNHHSSKINTVPVMQTVNLVEDE